MFSIFPRVVQSLCIHRSAHVCHTWFDAQFILWLAISRQYGSLVVILVSMDCTAKQTTLRMYAVRDETQGGFTETLCQNPRGSPQPQSWPVLSGVSLKPCARTLGEASIRTDLCVSCSRPGPGGFTETLCGLRPDQSGHNDGTLLVRHGGGFT